jgi:hypothetical protein
LAIDTATGGTALGVRLVLLRCSVSVRSRGLLVVEASLRVRVCVPLRRPALGGYRDDWRLRASSWRSSTTRLVGRDTWLYRAI